MSLINYDKNFSSEKKMELTSLYSLLKDEIIYDYSRDKLSIIKHALETKDPKYINMVNKSLLYIKRDLDRNHIDSNEIFGYKIVENKTIRYYTKNHTIVKDEDLRRIKKMLLLKNENADIHTKLIGYLEMKNADNILKIRDTINQGYKGTQIKTGSVCGNEGMKKSKIIGFLKYITNNNELYNGLNRNELPGKPNLCFELELLLRKYDNERKNNARWFYNLHETIEHELNKKNN